MHLFLCALATFYITSVSAMAEPEYDPLALPPLPFNFWITSQQLTPEEDEILKLEQSIKAFESQHVVKNSKHAMQILEQNKFHEGILLWAIAKGYNLSTIKKIGSIIHRKVYEEAISSEQFDKLVACHEKFLLDGEKVDPQIIKYVASICNRSYTTIKKRVAGFKNRSHKKGKTLKRIPPSKKLIEECSLELHFALCNQPNGEVVLVPRPRITRKKRHTPKTLKEIIHIKTNTTANTEEK